VLAPTEDKGGNMKDSFYEEVEYVFDQCPEYCMKILLGDFSAKVGREGIFKLMVENESVHKISNGVRVVNFNTSKYLIVKNTIFPHHNFHKYTWTSPDGKIQPDDHVFRDKRWHSSKVDVQSCRGSDCNIDHYLVVAEVSKQAAQKFYMERFTFKNLNDIEVKEQYQIKISSRFAALENLDDNDVDISKTWKSFRENLKASATESMGYYDMKQHKSWFDEECYKLLDERKQAKLQWLQNPSQTNVDNLNSVRCETSRTFKNKRWEYLKEKLMSLKQAERKYQKLI
jgi:hypothetical protein